MDIVFAVLSATEARRLKRIKEKLTDTTCFACREKGHAAKDCPTGVKTGEDADEGGGQSTAVGICYRFACSTLSSPCAQGLTLLFRCGSKKHSLSRCRKPNNPADPYPFASCFVCKGKGHLASACPQN